MKLQNIIITIIFVVGTSTPSSAGEIIFSNQVNAKIKSEAAQTKKTIPLKEGMASQNMNFLRTWVSGSLKLDQAKKRVNKIYQRTTYQQTLKMEQLRLPTERLILPPQNQFSKSNIKPQLNLTKVQFVRPKEPVKVVYREGPNYFKYQKVKEGKTETPLTKSNAKEMARNFLLENHFLRETDNDKIGNIYLFNRRINEEKEKGEKHDDYVVQQDVVFERYFEGKPVINSKIVVGMEPNTKEIILFKHYNWTPTSSEKVKTISKQELTKSGAPESANFIRSRIEEKINKTIGEFTKATVKEAIPAWYQTKTNIIPVMAFSIEIERPGPKGPLTLDYLEMINLVGSDDVFFKKN